MACHIKYTGGEIRGMTKKVIVISAILAVIVIILSLGFGWFFSSGIHFVWVFANFNLKEADCYIISDDVIIDRTTMTIDGLCRYSDTSMGYDCRFVIEGYTDITQGDMEEEFFVRKIDKRWTAQYYCYEWDVNGGLSGENETDLIVSMEFIENKPVARVYFGDRYERDDVYAVCADSKEDALRLYREYKESK